MKREPWMNKKPSNPNKQVWMDKKRGEETNDTTSL